MVMTSRTKTSPIINYPLITANARALEMARAHYAASALDEL